MDPLEITFTVACGRSHAFALWTTKASSWWPPSHTFSGDPMVDVIFEPRVGGRVYERAPDGRERDWGEILSFDPPSTLTYLWHLMFDRVDATEVTVTFTEVDAGTEVRIVHRGWERLGDRIGAERRDRTRAGWGAIIEHYLPACREAALDG